MISKTCLQNQRFMEFSISSGARWIWKTSPTSNDSPGKRHDVVEPIFSSVSTKPLVVESPFLFRAEKHNIFETHLYNFMNKSNSDGFICPLDCPEVYLNIYYHNISTYCLMYAVMLCTSLLQNASLPSSALRFWMLSPCRFCVERLLGPRSDVSVSWQNMSLEITHFNTRMLWSYKLLELFLFTVLSKMTQDLGSFAAHCGI